MSATACRIALMIALMTVKANAGASGAAASAIRYDAPAGCPDARAFIAAVGARTPKLVVREDAPRRFDVSVVAEGPNFRGTLRVDKASRAVDADSCAKVVEALAFVVALTIDPAATAPPATGPATATATTAPATTAPAPEGPDAAADTRRAAEPAERRPTASDGTSGATDAEGEQRPQPTSTGWRWQLGAGVELLGGIAPSPLGAASGSVGLARKTGGMRPELRLAALAGKGMLAEGSPAAGFSLLAGRLEACLRVASVARVAASPCVGASGGVLSAEGMDVAKPERARRPWLDSRLGAKLRFPEDESFYVELAAGAIFPVTRDAFVFHEPKILVHEVPVVAPFAGAGLAMSF